MTELTQETVNTVFADIKAKWDRMVAASGKTEKMFVILGGKEVTRFLANYQRAKEITEAHGLEMPVLVEGLTITVKDADE